MDGFLTQPEGCVVIVMSGASEPRKAALQRCTGSYQGRIDPEGDPSTLHLTKKPHFCLLIISNGLQMECFSPSSTCIGCLLRCIS